MCSVYATNYYYRDVVHKMKMAAHVIARGNLTASCVTLWKKIGEICFLSKRKKIYSESSLCAFFVHQILPSELNIQLDGVTLFLSHLEMVRELHCRLNGFGECSFDE